MEFRQLKYFIEIIDSGSLTKASRRLYIAQSALSQQVSKLEDEVGKPLLHRTAKGVAPTESGQALYNHARLMLRHHDQAISIARQESPHIQGMVSLGLAATTRSALGLPLVRWIRQKYPQVVLNVVEGMSGHLAQMMRLRQLDLAILFNPNALPDLKPIPLLQEELFVLAPTDSPLIPKDRTHLTLAEAAALPMILPTASHGLRRQVSAAFEQRNLIINTIAEIDSLSLLMDCVYEGMGVTIKPMAAILSQDERTRQWRAISISDARLVRGNYIYAIEDETDSPSVSAVAREIAEVTASLIHQEKWKGVVLHDNAIYGPAIQIAASSQNQMMGI
ncbi:LysR substrate-binding domain-containing protein [Paracandidimonas soli]|uniref:LysR family tcuABC transcriptional regulator n=1 Tax=Paracandidimonas soli TaxID=1917182 RepID=A0A4R3UZ41_9BURK|nr:LysR substrate-binding domain-containing protein [Paracandidimonas soli]TCU96087.1 LysR family tcuABC transcriptional regulator [Paracandidimonas soli]